jgi:hypothetical protein
MERLFTGLLIVIIVLGFSCGFLLYQIGEMQRWNSNLKVQTSQLDNEILYP